MNESISKKQCISLLVLFTISGNLILGINPEAKKDVWLALILGFILDIPVLWIYSKLLNLLPGKNIYELCLTAFGKVAGTFTSLLFIWFSLHLGGMVLFDFNIYIDEVGLTETPELVISIILLAMCVLAGKYGVRVLGRWGNFFFKIVLLLMLFIPLFSIQNMKPENLLPVLQNGLKPVLTGAISAYAFPLGEAVVFLPIMSMLQDKKSYFRVYFIGILISTLLLLITTLTNILVLGPYLLGNNYYPTYVTVSLISIGDFFQRIQILVSILFLLSGFVEISICVISASKGLSSIFNLKNYKFLLVPCAILIINLYYIVFENELEAVRFLPGFAHYYKIFITALLPLIVLIAAKFRLKKANNSPTPNSTT